MTDAISVAGAVWLKPSRSPRPAMHAESTPQTRVTGATADLLDWSSERKNCPTPAATKAMPNAPQSPPGICEKKSSSAGRGRHHHPAIVGRGECSDALNFRNKGGGTDLSSCRPLAKDRCFGGANQVDSDWADGPQDR